MQRWKTENAVIKEHGCRLSEEESVVAMTPLSSIVSVGVASTPVAV